MAASALATGLLLVLLVVGCPGGGNDVRGSDSPKGPATLTIRDPLSESLRYIPQSATVVAVAATKTDSGPLRTALDAADAGTGVEGVVTRFKQLVQEWTGLTLAGPALGGNPLVLARTGSGSNAVTLGAWVTAEDSGLDKILRGRGDLRTGSDYKDWTLYEGRSLMYAVRDRVLLLASTEKALRAMIDRRQKRGSAAGLTAKMFASRSATGQGDGGDSALVRVAVSGPMMRRLLAPTFVAARRLPWIAALRGGGFAVAVDGDGVHVAGRLRTDAATLSSTDLPVADGDQAPTPKGDAPTVVGLRNPAQTFAVAQQLASLAVPERLQMYAIVRDMLAQFAGIDVQKSVIATLTQDSTVTVTDEGEVTLRAQTEDPDGVRNALVRLSRAGRLAGIAASLGLAGGDMGGISIRNDNPGLQDGGVDTGGVPDRYTITRGGEDVAVIGLRDDVLVVSTDPNTDVDSVVDAPDTASGGGGGGSDGATGALRATLSPARVMALLVRGLQLPASLGPLVAGLGPATVSARAETDATVFRIDAAAQR